MNSAPAWTLASRWPALRAADGATTVRLAAEASGHDVVGADELSAGEARHEFADLMRDVADSAADLAAEDRAVLAEQLDQAIADLETAGARVVAGAGAGGGVLHVAVLPRARKHRAGYSLSAW